MEYSHDIIQLNTLALFSDEEPHLPAKRAAKPGCRESNDTHAIVHVVKLHPEKDARIQ